MGGSVGLKGTDEEAIVHEAMRRGAGPWYRSHADYPGASRHGADGSGFARRGRHLAIACYLGETKWMSEVICNPDEHRFKLPIDGGEGDIAAAYYRLENGRLALIHAEVPYRFTGQGAGLPLARGVFDAIRAREGKVVLRRSFMDSYYARHPGYCDIVIGWTGLVAAFVTWNS